MNVFFKDVEVVGKENIPKTGPILFVGNHNNQFVDPAMLMVHCPREVGFIMAQSSFSKPVIGQLARLAGCIGVKRAQDYGRKGTGKIVCNISDSPQKIIGINTKFTTECKVGETLAVKGFNITPKILDIVSDTELKVSDTSFEKELSPTGELFMIRPHINQTGLFSNVWNSLQDNECIGIFPEGGSHDRPTLLPLKGGVAIMALGALSTQPDLPLHIVPFGLTYSQGHRFRSHVFLEYGKPLKVDPELIAMFNEKKKIEACNELMTHIEKGLRDVTLNYPDFYTMQLLMLVRRLYQPSRKHSLSAEEYLELNKRFVLAYTEVSSKESIQELQNKVMDYNEKLQNFNLKDYQIENNNVERIKNFKFLLIFRVVYLLFLTACSLPGFILGLPIVIFTKRISLNMAKAAKQRSDVKIEGKDVIASNKIIIGLALTVILWNFYALIFYLWVRDFVMIIYFWIVLYFTSYCSIRAIEEALVVWKSSVPFVWSLLQKDWNQEINKLCEERARLQKEVRTTVEVVLPANFPELARNRVVSPEVLKSEENEKPTVTLGLNLTRPQIPKAKPIDDVTRLMDGLDDEFDSLLS